MERVASYNKHYHNYRLTAHIQTHNTYQICSTVFYLPTNLNYTHDKEIPIYQYTTMNSYIQSTNNIEWYYQQKLT